MILAIDPGTRCVGWALWDDSGLVRCGLVRSKAKELGQRAVELAAQVPRAPLAVVEKPRIYPYNKKLQPNDLIDLAFVAGACATAAASATTALPVEWKGQTPKEISHRRTVERLNRSSLAALKAGLADVPESLRHNVLDAVGIARWHVTGEKL
jgi:hypothetical protein